MKSKEPIGCFVLTVFASPSALGRSSSRLNSLPFFHFMSCFAQHVLSSMLSFLAGLFGGEIGWLETFGTTFCMLLIQFLLFKTHRARKVLPLEVVPSQFEIYVAITCFWLAFLGCIKTLLHVANLFTWSWSKLDGLTSGALILEEVSNYQNEESQTSFAYGFQTFNLIILTWQLQQITSFILETAFPFFTNLNASQTQNIFKNLRYRIGTLITFLHLLTTGHPTPPQKRSRSNQSQKPRPYLSSPNSSTLSTQITLQRTQSFSQNQKQRTLSWTLVIPPTLLNEMKETLGPSGGFGELGFCVGKEEVRFEGMGVGTSFGLTFGVEREEEKENEKEEEEAWDEGDENGDFRWLNRGKVVNGGGGKARSGVGRRRKTK